MAGHLVWLHEWVNITFSAVTFIESYIPQTVADGVGRKEPIKTLMMFTLNNEWICTVEELNADRLFTRQRARWNRLVFLLACLLGCTENSVSLVPGCQREQWKEARVTVLWAGPRLSKGTVKEGQGYSSMGWSQVVKGNSERRPGIQFYGLPALQHLCAVEHHSCWGQSVPFLKSVIMWLMLLEVVFFFSLYTESVVLFGFRIRTMGQNISASSSGTFFLLLDLMTFFDQYHSGAVDKALDVRCLESRFSLTAEVPLFFLSLSLLLLSIDDHNH